MTDDSCPRHDTPGTDGLCTCSPNRVRQRLERDAADKAARASLDRSGPSLAKARKAIEKARNRKDRK